MKTLSFVLGVFCLAFAFCAVLEDNYAKACWFLILGLTDIYTAIRRLQ